MTKNNIILIDPNELKPHEQISPSRALYLLMKIGFSDYFTTPLLVDMQTKTILDGHHRHWVAKKFGFKKIPCYCVDYLEDNRIQVYPRRADIPVDKSRVIEMALARRVFPNKTTRHEYTIPDFEPLMLRDLK